MKVSAGLGAAKSEFAGFIRHKFDFRNPVPVGLKVAVLVFPGVLEKGRAFSHDKFNRMSIEQETVGGIKGGGF